MQSTLPIETSRLVNLAVESWRLNRWAFDEAFAKQRAVARHVARELRDFLLQAGIEISDLTNKPYDPGMAVEVVDSISDPNSPQGSVTIEETVAPIVLWRGAVVRHGQVVTRCGTMEQEANG